MATMQLANNYFPVMFFFSFFLFNFPLFLWLQYGILYMTLFVGHLLLAKNVSWEREWKKNDRNETRKALD